MNIVTETRFVLFSEKTQLKTIKFIAFRRLNAPLLSRLGRNKNGAQKPTLFLEGYAGCEDHIGIRRGLPCSNHKRAIRNSVFKFLMRNLLAGQT